MNQKRRNGIVIVLLLFTLISVTALGMSSPPLFKPYVIYPAICIYGSIGIGDFNDDGLPDIVTSNNDLFYAEFQIKIFLQNAQHTLDPPIIYGAGGKPDTLATGDLNDDLKDDIVVANMMDNTISVFLQQEDGTMSPHVQYPTADNPYGIEVADLNNDGLFDVVVSHWNDYILGVFLQQSDGTLGGMIEYWSPMGGYDDIGVGDLNNDGLSDVVKMSGQRNGSLDLSVYLQNQNGNLDSPIVIDAPTRMMGNGIAVGDITGDGLDDIVMSWGGNSWKAGIIVYAQNMEGNLELNAQYDSYEIPKSVAISDVDLDGRLDVLVDHSSWESLSIYLQNSTGELEPFFLIPLPYYMNHPTRALVAGDLNSDGLPDIAFAHYLGPTIFYHFPIMTERIILPYIAAN